MAGLFERTITHRGVEYKIAADLDDAAIMEDKLVATVQASVRRLPDEVWLKETVELAVDFAQSVVEVKVRGRVIATVPLTLPIPDSSDLLGGDIDIVADDHLFDHAIGPVAVEELIHLIPTDPLFGCFVKGAVSTVVGQIIRCWRTRQRTPLRQLIRDIGGCLREHSPRMALTFMFRVGRCVALLGMG
jgi:hypothetical protein